MGRTTLSGVVGVLVVAAGLAGCAGGRKAVVAVQGPVLGPQYPTTVQVENWRGTVTVTADPKAKAPRVRAVNHRAGPLAHGTDVAGAVDATAVSSFENGRPVLRVTTRPTMDPPANVTTNLKVVVPQLGGATIHNTGGAVELAGVAGPVLIENGAAGREGGDVVVWTGAPMTDPVNISTSKGHIVYQAGPGSTGRFDVSTDKGRADFVSMLGEVRDARPEGSRYRGILTDGGNAVVLHSGWGNVTARVMNGAGTYVPNEWRGDLGWPGSPGWFAKMGETMKLREPGAP